ncbi:MAG: hypothetical protein AAF745_11160 [Planctomycetota bacterium]
MTQTKADRIAQDAHLAWAEALPAIAQALRQLRAACDRVDEQYQIYAANASPELMAEWTPEFLSLATPAWLSPDAADGNRSAKDNAQRSLKVIAQAILVDPSNPSAGVIPFNDFLDTLKDVV